MAKFESRGNIGHFANKNILKIMKPGTQYYGNVNVMWISQDCNNQNLDQNWIDKQLDQQMERERARRNMEDRRKSSLADIEI